MDNGARPTIADTVLHANMVQTSGIKARSMKSLQSCRMTQKNTVHQSEAQSLNPMHVTSMSQSVGAKWEQ